MSFLPQETIIRKRDGLALTPQEIKAFIQGLVAGTVSEAQAAAFAMAVLFRDMKTPERVALTEAMRERLALVVFLTICRRFRDCLPPISIAATVMTGMDALRARCRQRIRMGAAPRARALRA